jgi:hypothetical protein
MEKRDEIVADIADHQVSPAIRTPGDLLGLHGLRPEVDCCGWCYSALEGFWAGYG